MFSGDIPTDNEYFMDAEQTSWIFAVFWDIPTNLRMSDATKMAVQAKCRDAMYSVRSNKVNVI
jgi:phosphate-selective porin